VFLEFADTSNSGAYTYRLNGLGRIFALFITGFEQASMKPMPDRPKRRWAAEKSTLSRPLQSAFTKQRNMIVAAGIVPFPSRACCSQWQGHRKLENVN
jgi:hypothetical protein